MTAHAGPELRFETTATLVFVDGRGRPVAWPAPLRTKLLELEDQFE